VHFFFGMIISCSEMEKSLGSFNKKKINLHTHLIFVAKDKRDRGKTFFDIFFCKKHQRKF
jgi:hypothetical protein